MFCPPNHKGGNISDWPNSNLIVQALVVAGGNNGSANLASILTLYPGAESWTSLAPLPRALYGAKGLIVGGRLRLTGGRDDGGSYRSEVKTFKLTSRTVSLNYISCSFQVLEYYPTPWNTWVKIGNLPAGRALHAVVPIGPKDIACVAGKANIFFLFLSFHIIN